MMILYLRNDWEKFLNYSNKSAQYRFDAELVERVISRTNGSNFNQSSCVKGFRTLYSGPR